MIKRLWQTNRRALLAFAVALCAVGYFAVKTINATLYWMDPAHNNEPLAGWMTPRYVSLSYKLPSEILAPALFSVKGEGPRRQSLDALAAEHGVTLQDLQERVNAAARQWQIERQEQRRE